MKVRRVFIPLVTAVLAAAAQEQPSKFEKASVILARVPESARMKQNPLGDDLDAVRAGEKLFEMHCAECHGRMAGGGKRGPSLMEEQIRRAEPGEIFWILTNGVVRRGMPAWSKLPDQQRWQIVRFLSQSR